MEPRAILINHPLAKLEHVPLSALTGHCLLMRVQFVVSGMGKYRTFTRVEPRTLFQFDHACLHGVQAAAATSATRSEPLESPEN